MDNNLYMDYKEICFKVKDLAVEVGKYVREERAKLNESGIEIKGKNDFVTYVDKNSEKQIIKGLISILPNSGFFAEENTNTSKGEVYNWVIDPIDGTTNFIHGLSPHAISIALLENSNLVVGVVYEVGMNECFYAWKGGGAYCNGKQIFVSTTKNVEKSLIAIGFPYNDYSIMDKFIQTMVFLMKNSHGLRRLGSAATDLAYVAAGRFEAFYEYGLKPWDVAAGAIIVQEAGGTVCDFSGNNNFLFGGELVSTNSLVHDELMGIISKGMK